MQLDDEICLCFHVSKRKVVNFLRVERPRAPSQLSECFGAGTGCGWCRSYLRRLFDDWRRGLQPAEATDAPTAAEPAAEPTPAEYARARAAYVRAGRGTPPPGATPLDPPPS